MSGATRMVLAAFFALFAVGAIGVSAAIADDEVKLVFHVEGMT